MQFLLAYRYMRKETVEINCKDKKNYRWIQRYCKNEKIEKNERNRFFS